MSEMVYSLCSSLAVGNTVVILISSECELLYATHLLTQLYADADVPEGTINMLIVDNLVSVLACECVRDAAIVTCFGDREVRDNRIKVNWKNH